jgi:hypothetical protein
MNSEAVADVVVVAAARGSWEAGEKDGWSAARRFSRGSGGIRWGGGGVEEVARHKQGK